MHLLYKGDDDPTRDMSITPIDRVGQHIQGNVGSQEIKSKFLTIYQRISKVLGDLSLPTLTSDNYAY